MKILIIGGDGFLGSHMVDQAVQLGHTVSVFDRFSGRTSKNLEHRKSQVRFLAGEFSNRALLASALEGQEIVFHFVWSANPATSWNDPFVELENIRSSVQLFELAAQRGVQKIVFPSSGGTVYGCQTKMVGANTLPDPFSPYGISKLTAEFFLKYFNKRTNLQYDIYRIGNAYGPRQPVSSSQGVIPAWMNAILNKSVVQVYGDQDVLRDYVYVEDIAHLMTYSIQNLASSGIYNIGTGIGTSVIELLEIFREVINEPFEFSISSKRAFDNSSAVLDGSKIKSFFPDFTYHKLRDKIPQTWNDFKQERRLGKLSIKQKITIPTR